MPQSLTATGHEFSHVQSVYLPIAGAVLVVVAGAMTFAVIRYRAREGRAARATRDRNAIEVAIGLGLAAVVALLVVVTLNANADITGAPKHERAGFRVDVLAFRWGWQFTYPSLPGVVDRTTAQARAVLHVPAHTVVRFRLRTIDVTHAFWIPAERYKADAWPGTVRTFDLAFDEGSSISGRCAQYCGLKHSDMTFKVDALSPADFRAWAARAR
jgi:cytochrome c oxidase subunit II